VIQKCCVCKKIYGEKEPYENKSITHGYCNECFVLALAKIKNTLKGGQNVRKHFTQRYNTRRI